MTAERSLNPSAELCLSCGLCCNGALFPHAYFIFGENLTHWKRKGFDLVEEEGAVFFELGCPHLDGAACTIYDQPRPHTCGGFRCKPLQQMEDGEIELEQALVTVGKALEISKTVRTASRQAGKRFKSRNFYSLRHALETSQADQVADDENLIGYALEQLDAFDRYAEEQILPAHVLEEMAEDQS